MLFSIEQMLDYDSTTFEILTYFSLNVFKNNKAQ